MGSVLTSCLSCTCAVDGRACEGDLCRVREPGGAEGGPAGVHSSPEGGGPEGKSPRSAHQGPVTSMPQPTQFFLYMLEDQLKGLESCARQTALCREVSVRHRILPVHCLYAQFYIFRHYTLASYSLLTPST